MTSKFRSTFSKKSEIAFFELENLPECSRNDPEQFRENNFRGFSADFGAKTLILARKKFSSKTHVIWRATAFSSSQRPARRNFAFKSVEIIEKG